jgi:pilus assembly protein Flp/PilA
LDRWQAPEDFPMFRRCKFFRDDEGTTSVEYAIMLALILMSVITGVTAFGMAQSTYWGKIGTEMHNHGIS